MCEIDYERNDLDGALQYAEYAIDIAYQHGILGSYVPAVILKSRVLWAKKRAEESMDTLVQAMNYLWRSRLDRTLWYGLLNARLVNCRLSIGDFDCADEWVRQSKLSQDAAIMDNQEVEMITYIRAIAARGRIDEALICAEKLLKTAKQRRQKMTELEAHAWLAILLESKNQSYAGLLHMQQALEIGEREGYLRTFADMPELVPLLGRYVEVRKQHYMPELRETVSFSYVRSILAAAGETAAGTIGESEGGTSAALTTREREVLQQIAAGLSNKEIAARLVLTEGTVKLHLHHIYGKLQVKGRVQAIQRARELRLLS
jgi:LuxR family maltose regulon positive regulatory protein